MPIDSIYIFLPLDKLPPLEWGSTIIALPHIELWNQLSYNGEWLCVQAGQGEGGMTLFNCQPHGRGKIYHDASLRYEGEIAYGTFGGLGTQHWPGGTKYIGPFIDEAMCGKGLMTYRKGGYYKGDFVDNEKNGQGIEKYSLGDIYRGGFVNGHREGQGMMVDVNGSWYRGGWKEGEWHGFGVRIDKEKDNGYKYSGHFNNGDVQGVGRLEQADGVVIVGSFANGKISQGTITYPDGSEYCGPLLDGMYEGRGMYKTKEYTYDRFHHLGHKHGYGEIKHFTAAVKGTTSTTEHGISSIYKGIWRKGKRHGRGVHMCFEHHLSWRGNWTKDHSDGEGVATVGNLRRYISEFAMGARVRFQRLSDTPDGEDPFLEAPEITALRTGVAWNDTTVGVNTDGQDISCLEAMAGSKRKCRD